MSGKKTFREKLADDKDFPRVEAISPGMAEKWGEGTIVIPAPGEVDQIMRGVPHGKLITINQIRQTVARRHGATIGCPITTGIFARIAAGAAGEEQAGEQQAGHSFLADIEGRRGAECEVSRWARRAARAARSRGSPGGGTG
ncbi:MAG: hypothetical protein ACE5JX_11535 [Acidobacteriota bacterium]